MRARPTPGDECPRCGCKSVRPKRRTGRTVPYRVLRALEIPGDAALPTCGRCKYEALDAATLRLIRPQLDEAYRAILRNMVRDLINKVTVFTSQRRLEQLLGLSQGYLSRLRAGAATPSTELLCALALIASDPRTRLTEIALLWSTARSQPDALDPLTVGRNVR